MIDYVENICEVDLQELDSPPNPSKMKDIMSAIARNIGTQAEIKTMAKEARISRLNTVSNYMEQLTKIFILDELKP
jgi:predicted AAA+ superfamily ATPase